MATHGNWYSGKADSFLFVERSPCRVGAVSDRAGLAISLASQVSCLDCVDVGCTIGDAGGTLLYRRLGVGRGIG